MEVVSEIFAHILNDHPQPINGGSAARFKWMRGIAEACHGEGIPKDFVFEQMKQYSDRSFSEEAILQSAIMPIYKTTGQAATEDPLPEQRHRIQRIEDVPTQTPPPPDTAELDAILAGATFTADTACEPPTSHNHQRQVAGNTRQLLTTDRQGQITQNVFNILAAGARYPDQQLT